LPIVLLALLGCQDHVEEVFFSLRRNDLLSLLQQRNGAFRAGGNAQATANASGQINGGGEDKFRIKIWNKANDGLVYDSQFGSDDDAECSTLLGGGSIVIHKAK
jgi:hypothetical protein